MAFRLGELETGEVNLGVMETEEVEKNSPTEESSWGIAKGDVCHGEIQKESEAKETQAHRRKAYESHLVGQLGERRKYKLEPCDDEEHRHLCLCSSLGAIEDLRPKIRLSTLPICQKEGKLGHVEIGKGQERTEVWKGVSFEYRYLSLAAAYMRLRWISQFDLYGELMWWNRQHASSEQPEDSMNAEIRLSPESAGGGSRNPLLMTQGGVIRCCITLEYVGKMHESEGYGRTWLGGAMYPQFGRLRKSEIRREFNDILLEGE